MRSGNGIAAAARLNIVLIWRAEALNPWPLNSDRVNFQSKPDKSSNRGLSVDEKLIKPRNTTKRGSCSSSYSRRCPVSATFFVSRCFAREIAIGGVLCIVSFRSIVKLCVTRGIDDKKIATARLTNNNKNEIYIFHVVWIILLKGTKAREDTDFKVERN